VLCERHPFSIPTLPHDTGSPAENGGERPVIERWGGGRLVHLWDTPLVGVNTRAQSATENRRFTDARHPLPSVSHGDLALERGCAGHQARRPIGQAKHNRKRR